MIATLLTRLAPKPLLIAAQPAPNRPNWTLLGLTFLASKAPVYKSGYSNVAIKPAQNRHPDIVIKLDNTSQVAINALHRLINTDLTDSLAFPPVQTQQEFTADQLLRLTVILPPPKGGDFIPEYIRLTHAQYGLLLKYIDLQMRWLNTHQTSRLWDFTPWILQITMQGLLDRLHRRTKILTWSELCNRQSNG